MVFRAGAAFAKPEVCEALEERGVRYAIRILANDSLERDTFACVPHQRVADAASGTVGPQAGDLIQGFSLRGGDRRGVRETRGEHNAPCARNCASVTWSGGAEVCMSRFLWIALLVASNCLAAGKQRKELAWAELGPAIAGQKIQLVLPGGVEIQGNVLGVEPEALRLDVTKTSDKKAVRKGENSIPRPAVSTIRISRYTKRWRLLLTPGLPGTLMLAMTVAIAHQRYTPDPGKVIPIGMAVTASSTIAGYYVGKHLDRQELTEIKIVR